MKIERQTSVHILRQDCRMYSLKMWMKTNSMAFWGKNAPLEYK